MPDSLGSSFNPRGEMLYLEGLKAGPAFWTKPVVPPGAREGQHTAIGTEGPASAEPRSP